MPDHDHYMAEAVQVSHERPVLIDHFLKLQKADGHWIDSKDHTGESYGTAMGLLVLSAPAWAETTDK